MIGEVGRDIINFASENCPCFCRDIPLAPFSIPDLPPAPIVDFKEGRRHAYQGAGLSSQEGRGGCQACPVEGRVAWGQENLLAGFGGRC
jgi:hypothetical protein